MSFQTHCSGALNEEGEIALLNPGFLMDLRVCTMFYYSKCEHWTSLREIFHILDDSPLTSEIHKYIGINKIYSEIKMSPLTVLELHLGTTTTLEIPKIVLGVGRNIHENLTILKNSFLHNIYAFELKAVLLLYVFSIVYQRKELRKGIHKY